MNEQAKYTPFQQAILRAYRYGRVDEASSFSQNDAILDSITTGFATMYPCENAAPGLLDFAIQYLYSEHGECSPEDCACPFFKEQLRKMARSAIANAKKGAGE